ncbi:hypothetical protein AMAG_19402 [Allomyces macrogynus ATCC 38327]|uniref:Uncharacterized protein n=1 Tax=Allomyces macrogynus (strain ATCC 38327) TaxID=578462 RepID=A0A0L0SQY9_ALLM3|nr:hypothetical protein AMAG_19402 [Allomyces macrogynus ATCC 38327]|eukprot:KNE64922.1 hypothetical protein AMAG_19402 [Allomyces macrogynus ATCC 38327]
MASDPSTLPSVPLDCTLVSFDSLAAAVKSPTPAKSPRAASVRTRAAATATVGAPRNRSASTSSSCVTAVPLPLPSAPPVPPLVPASNRSAESPPGYEHDALPLSTLSALPEAGTPHLARVASATPSTAAPQPISDCECDGDVLLPGVSVPLTHLPTAREDLRALHPKPRANLYIHGLLLKLLAAHDKSLDEADTRAIMQCRLYTHRSDDSVLYAVRAPETTSQARRTSTGSEVPVSARRTSMGSDLPARRAPDLRERSASDSAALPQATRRWSDPPTSVPRRASASSATAAVAPDAVSLSPPLPTASTTTRRLRRLSSTASVSSLSACDAQCSDAPLVAPVYPSPPDSPRSVPSSSSSSSPSSSSRPAPVPRLESLADLAMSTPISPIVRQATRTGPLLAALVLRPDLHALCLPWRAHALARRANGGATFRPRKGKKAPGVFFWC